MLRVAYVFERFPSFGQTFCYREVAELIRQGADLPIFSIRRPAGEPAQNWEAEVVKRVRYLPDEAGLAKELKRLALPKSAVAAIEKWGRQSDFLRLQQAAWIGAYLREEKIERVHAHFAGMAARTAYWIRQFFGIDYSLTAHANDIFAPREFAISLTSLLDAACAIVTVSDFAVARLRAQFPQNAGKIHRVYNGVEVARFTPANFRTTPPLIVSVGRLIEKKGFEDLIKACALLRAQDWRCEIIGEGPLQEILSRQIAAAGLENRIQLLGPKTENEIAARLAAAYVFVLPCRQTEDGDMDNLPTVIMEAMAAGLPVVSTTLAGIPEMVQPGVNGELVAPNESSSLAKAISELLTQPERARAGGEAGRRLAAEKFSLARNVEALAEILK